MSRIVRFSVEELKERRKDRRKASDAAYRAANPGKILAQRAADYAANREKYVAQQAAYRAANPEKVKARAAAYRAANQEKIVARDAAYRAANQEKIADRDAAWRAAHPEKAAATCVKQRLRKYGLTVEQYNIMLSEQNGTCGICKLVCLTGRRLAVDHCHDTKAVRGLLCSNCNRGNGSLKESPKNLAASLRYLAKHGKALTTEEVDELTRDLHHYT